MYEGERTMKRTRIGSVWLDDDPAGGFSVEHARRTALMAIEEVLGGTQRASPTTATIAGLPASLPTAPPGAPAPSQSGDSARVRRRRRRTRRARRRPLLVALTLGLALCIGALFGSGAFNATDRYNAELVAAQQVGAELYEVPEVHGHPGAAPTRERSGSIREFLGMASVF
jgi:hypothetical protein